MINLPLSIRHGAGVLCLLVFAPLVSVAEHIEPPQNPFLADSPWPISHQNSYLQGSSSLPGPLRGDRFRVQYQDAEPGSITLAYGPKDDRGNRAIWGNSLKHIYKIDANGKKWIYAVRQPRRRPIRSALSGAYCLVDCDGVFYTANLQTIEAFGDQCVGNSLSGIRKLRQFNIPACQVQSDSEKIIGLNMTYDGFLVFVTSHGTVGVLSRDLKCQSFVRTGKNERVSNSLAVDEDGGIYVVTTKYMYRFQWDDAGLTTRWKAPYKTADQDFPGRFGAGSGTTPSLMGVGDQDKFVVICDGQRLMHLLLYWRDEIPADWCPIDPRNPRLAAETPIRFGDRETSRSSTEQSVLVSGYDAAVVSNDYGQIRRRPKSRTMTDFLRAYLSGHEHIRPYGVEKFSWDPICRRLTSTWANRCLSCPNAIPTMSRATMQMYFIGNRERTWTLEAVDWNSGASNFFLPLGNKQRFNSYFSGTQIGTSGDIVTGTFTGLLRISPER
ncbi:MAG: hypothetical protein HKN47_01175 [Pirellulaceae bacterium]|nr:hypothetical protein [Pirellulaceae bacterium]